MELIEPLLAEQFQGIFDLHRTPVTSAAQNESTTNRKRRLGKRSATDDTFSTCNLCNLLIYIYIYVYIYIYIYIYIFVYIYIYHLCNIYVCYMLFDGILCVFLSMVFVS